MRPLVAAIAALLLAACGQAVSGEARFMRKGCGADLKALGDRAECGALIVEETRGSGNGRAITMPVVIVRAAAPKPGLPPVIWLHGGPGGGEVGNVGRIAGGSDDLVAIDQDWIFLEQRGGYRSKPGLDCGKVALTDAGPPNDKAVEQLAACARRHRADGVDLSRYNAAEVARDVADLRRLLELKEVDLYGISYGTAIALAVLRHAPEGVRAVVLDSVWPPDAGWAENTPVAIANATRALIARCEAQAPCAARHKGLQAKVDAFAAGLLTAPATYRGRRYTAEDFAGFLMEGIYNGRQARRLPILLEKITSGDLSPLAEYVKHRSGYFEAQHMTHLCKEEMPFESPARTTANAGADPVARAAALSLNRYFEACEAFDVGAPNPVDGQPAASSVPTLFLAAELDPGCPPDLARLAATRFPKGQVAVFPNTTHGVIQSPCARRMMRAFLADPGKPVNTDCIAREHASFEFIEG